MFTRVDPLTRDVFTVLISIVMGTCLLVVVAMFLHWQKADYSHYVQSLQERFRPYLTPLLSGTWTKEGVNVLRSLLPAELEVLFDPLFAKGKRRTPARGPPGLVHGTRIGRTMATPDGHGGRDSAPDPLVAWGIRAANRRRVHAPAATRQGHPQPGGAGP